MFEPIAWATDGSELADKALDHVRELAKIHGSRIVAPGRLLCRLGPVVPSLT